MIEKVKAQIIAEVDKKSLSQSEKELERLTSPEAIELKVNLAKLRQELKIIRSAIAQAEKDGDMSGAIALRVQDEELRKKLTQANRELTNFVRTGDKELSVLGNLFKQVGMDVNSGVGLVINALGNELTKAAATAFNAVGLGATKTGKHLNDLKAQIDETGSGFSGMIAIGGLTALGAGIGYVGKQALFLADRYEQASISFEVMLGSAEQAQIMLQELQRIAVDTPFELQGIRDTTKQLLAFGISAKDIPETIINLGNIASATGTDLGRIAYAYGQVASAGKLFGTELRQFTEAGVPLLAELASMYDINTFEARKMVEEGKILFPQVEEAFRRMSSEGGIAFNMMARQTETFSGQVARLKDSINVDLERAGGSFLGLAKKVVGALASISEFFSKNAKYIAGFFSNLVFIFQHGFSVVVSTFQASSAVIVGILRGTGEAILTFSENVLIMVQNLGISFGNIPVLMQEGLNAGLDTLSGFLNSSSRTINSWLSSIGIDSKLSEGFSFGKLTFGGEMRETKEFKEFNFNSFVQSFQDGNTIFKKGILERETALKNHLSEMEQLFGAESLMGGELIDNKKGGGFIDDSVDKGGKAGSIAKDIKESQDDVFLDLAKTRREAKEFAIKTLKDELKAREKWADDSKKYIDTVKKAQDEYAKSREKEMKNEADFAKKIADRYKQIGEELEKLKETQTKLSPDVARTADTLKNIAFESSFDSIDNIELIRKYLKEQEAISKLENEQLLAGANTNKESIEESNLSPTERLIKERDLQRKAIEQERESIEKRVGIKEFEIQSILDIENKKYESLERMIEAYKSVISKEEQTITDTVARQTMVRSKYYAIEEQRIRNLIDLRDSISGNTGGATTNNITTVVNAQVSNNLDINTLGNKLADKIDLSLKGIN